MAMAPDSTDVLLERARAGDRNAFSELLAAHTPALERMVSLRLDPRLERRIEAADIVQESLALAAQRFAEWSAQQRYPFGMWLRMLTAQALTDALREHHRQRRDLAREVNDAPTGLHATCERAADWLVSTHTSPTEALRRDEVRALVLAALAGLEDLDREVLVLRYFEQLTNEEAAAELGIHPGTASKRFARALQRIRPALRTLADHGAKGER